MKSIVIIIDYFGEWPVWFPLFIESCKKNPTVHRLFHTDCAYEAFEAENITFKYLSKTEYIKQVNKKLKVKFAPQEDYKLCDLRPMYGVLYEDEIAGFDFYGYGDIDVIYGNIRHFYTHAVLDHDIISTHVQFISGHLALLKNVKRVRNAFRQYKGWREVVENPAPQRFDEDLFIKALLNPTTNSSFSWFSRLFKRLVKEKKLKLYLQEQYTTPLTPLPWKYGGSLHPQVWHWKDGTITNEMDPDNQYIYLHFMNFFSGRWMDAMYQKEPVWKELEKFVFITPIQLLEKGMRIDRLGFHVLDS